MTTSAPSQGPFAEATAVTDLGAGRYGATIQPGWDIAANANGGYLLAILGRALSEQSGHPDPITVTGHYLRPGKPGPVLIETDVVRASRRFATMRATMFSGDGDARTPLVTVLGTFSDLDLTTGPTLVDPDEFDLPALEECTRIEATDTFPPPFMAHVDVRLHPEDTGFYTGQGSGVPRMRGWFRLPEEEVIDTVSLLCAVDSFPPNIFNANLPVAWTPTLELTAHVRARPVPGWLRCGYRSRYIDGGFLESDGVLFDESDRLVAQVRQLALAPLG